MVTIPKIIKTNRKTIALEINSKAELIVKAPKNVCVVDISTLILKHNDWIIKKQDEARKKLNKMYELDFDTNKVPEYKKFARKQLKTKVEKISRLMDLYHKDFRISNASKRWGSCNSKKEIKLSWKLIFTPDEIQNYVVIHELAHIKHLNHSKNFWVFVEKHDPKYKEHKKWLSENDFILGLGV